MAEPQITAVTGVIFHPRDDKFIILQRSLEEIAFPGKWAFPGGKKRDNERLVETLRREVREETGLGIEECPQCIDVYTFMRPDNREVRGVCYTASALQDHVVLGRGFLGYNWVTPAELRRYDHIEGMINQVEIAKQVLNRC